MTFMGLLAAGFVKPWPRNFDRFDMYSHACMVSGQSGVTTIEKDELIHEEIINFS
jgi:hypothetical protein